MSESEKFYFNWILNNLSLLLWYQDKDQKCWVQSMADMHCDFHRVCCNENINMADSNTSLDHLS